MQINVECGGFTRAADACLTANQTAAVLTQALAARLGHHGGMAGNDATSATFARAYDWGAHESLAALADLTHAFIGAGRLLEATGAEHAAAESASAGVRTAAYVGGGLADSYVRVQPPRLLPSLGGQEPSLGTVDAWILDQVEGFVWPSADVDGLRSAAAEWRRAAAATAGLVDHLEAAVALVELQRSPEVPLAVDALTDLGSLVGDTAWELSSVATACEEYADAVEAARERTRALLAEVAQMIVEGAAVSAIVTGLTGGLAGGAALGAAAARVRAQAPRFYALLTALRAGATTAATRLDRAVDELVVIRSRVEKFVRVPARGERGSMKHPSSWLGRDRKPGWLKEHEVPPGHTIERHVGKSAEELAERLADTTRRQASSFVDQATAERSIDRVVDHYADRIRAWVDAGGSDKLVLRLDLGESTGTVLLADGTTLSPTAVKVVLIPSNRGGWHLLTAYPD